LGEHLADLVNQGRNWHFALNLHNFVYNKKQWKTSAGLWDPGHVQLLISLASSDGNLGLNLQLVLFLLHISYWIEFQNSSISDLRSFLFAFSR